MVLVVKHVEKRSPGVIHLQYVNIEIKPNYFTLTTLTNGEQW